MEQLIEVLHECQRRGLPLPYLIVAVSLNGIMFGMHFDGEREPEVIFDMPEGSMMQLPINMMVVDATGGAAHVVFTPKGVTFH